MDPPRLEEAVWGGGSKIIYGAGEAGKLMEQGHQLATCYNIISKTQANLAIISTCIAMATILPGSVAAATIV
eukprot:scaffold26570_cov71-Skeletonema_dohrnii-CCMP3373.AAC.1